MKIKLLSVALFITLATSVFAQVPRKVLVEDFTGTWCGWCPLGRTTAEHIEATYPNTTINVGMHWGDAYQVAYSNAIDSVNNYGFPGFMLDRTPLNGWLFQGVGSCTGSDLDFDVNQRTAITAPCGVNISSTYNSVTRALAVTVSTRFAAAFSGAGAVNLNCILVEDSVSSNSVQNNYMNTDNSYPCWEGVGDPITTYYQRDVARISLSSNWGDGGVIPNSVPLNGVYSKVYNYTLPGAWNSSHMFIVGFVSEYKRNSGVMDTNNIYVLNANVCRLGQTATQAVSEINNSNLTAASVYPNPFSDETTVSYFLKEKAPVSVIVYNAFGQKVAVIHNDEDAAGDHILRWNGKSISGGLLPAGLYLCVISSGDNLVTKKIQIVR